MYTYIYIYTYTYVYERYFMIFSFDGCFNHQADCEHLLSLILRSSYACPRFFKHRESCSSSLFVWFTNLQGGCVVCVDMLMFGVLLFESTEPPTLEYCNFAMLLGLGAASCTVAVLMRSTRATGLAFTNTTAPNSSGHLEFWRDVT